jgi:hypothetical protein
VEVVMDPEEEVAQIAAVEELASMSAEIAT